MDDAPVTTVEAEIERIIKQASKNFGCIEDARTFCTDFFIWYNIEHRNTGIGLMTSEQVHYEMVKQIYQARTEVFQLAFENNSKG